MVGVFLILILALDDLASAHQSIWMHPEPANRIEIDNKCKSLFTAPYVLKSYSYKSNSAGQLVPTISSVAKLGRPDEYDKVDEKILQSWAQVHSYTTPEKIKMLKDRSRDLDHLRTSYFYYQNEAGDSIGIRVFDASTEVYFQGEKWTDISASTSKAPLEISLPGFLLPGRADAKKFFAWELGLLNADPSLAKGTELAFTQVAMRLDTAYNDEGYTFFGSTQTVAQLKMKIFAQTRLAQVPFFEKYGLKPVMKRGADGIERPIELTPGMILIAADAQDFITINFGLRLFANRKSESQRYDEKSMMDHIKHNQEFLRQLDQNKLEISSLDELSQISLKLIDFLKNTKRFPAWSEYQSQNLNLFVTSYFRLINSIPEKWRSSSWKNMRHLLLRALTQSSPQLAYYYLYSGLSIGTSDQFSKTYDPAQEKNFFENLPLMDRLVLPLDPDKIRRH